MPGKGKGKGKGKEVVRAPTPVRPKWDEKADSELLDTILLLGKFNIGNWKDVYHDFHEVKGFRFKLENCQSRWSSYLRASHTDRIKVLAQGQLPHLFSPHNMPPEKQHTMLEDDNSYAAGSIRPPTAAAAAGPASSALPTTTPPHQPPFVIPDQVAALENGVPICLYDQAHNYLGKIEVKNGFRTIEIKDTLYISLPLFAPAPATAGSEILTPPHHPHDDLSAAGLGENPYYPEAYTLPLDPFIDAGAFD